MVAFRGTYSIANTIADLSTIPQEYLPYPGGNDSSTVNSRVPLRCDNCTVHSGFYNSWKNTRDVILPVLEDLRLQYPNYTLTLVGHSLGGAVALLGSLDLAARGWDPHVTTFGEPRTGNKALTDYVDAVFDLSRTDKQGWKYHRVTHVGDPVPLLPVHEWGYRMHAGEVFISKSGLPPTPEDLEYCDGDEDPRCIMNNAEKDPESVETSRWDFLDRLKLWQLFFAHRDYFWRLGLCVPNGDPWDWGRGKQGPLKSETR